MIRRLAVLALMAVLASSCAGRTTDAALVLDLLADLETRPHEFSYREVVEGVELVVTGTVEDDLRRSGKLTVDGVELLEQVVSDDGMALRVFAPDLVPGLSGLEDPDAEAALRAGDWVVDHVGAPDLLPPVTREGFVATGLGPLLDAHYALGYLRRAIQDGAAVREHNSDDPEYQPLDDPFTEITERELSRSQGYRRFDVLAPSLPGPAQRDAAPPDVSHFRKIAFFVRGERIVKVLEEVSFERREFRRALEGRQSEFYLELLANVVAGGTLEPVRLRSMSYDVLQLGRPFEVELPLDAHAGSLAGLLAAMGEHPEAEEPAEITRPPAEEEDDEPAEAGDDVGGGEAESGP